MDLLYVQHSNLVSFFCFGDVVFAVKNKIQIFSLSNVDWPVYIVVLFCGSVLMAIVSSLMFYYAMIMHLWCCVYVLFSLAFSSTLIIACGI